MPDCSGYGIAAQIDLCVDGPVGLGQRANLTVTIRNTTMGNFMNPAPSVMVSDWDGSEVKLDITSFLSNGLNTANCTTTASLTITPDDGTNTGTMLLEYVFTDCMPQPGSDFEARVFENCGGAGPHVVSEMMMFTLDGMACPV